MAVSYDDSTSSQTSAFICSRPSWENLSEAETDATLATYLMSVKINLACPGELSAGHFHGRAQTGANSVGRANSRQTAKWAPTKLLIHRRRAGELGKA